MPLRPLPAACAQGRQPSRSHGHDCLSVHFRGLRSRPTPWSLRDHAPRLASMSPRCANAAADRRPPERTPTTAKGVAGSRPIPRGHTVRRPRHHAATVNPQRARNTRTRLKVAADVQVAVRRGPIPARPERADAALLPAHVRRADHGARRRWRWAEGRGDRGRRTAGLGTVAPATWNRHAAPSSLPQPDRRTVPAGQAVLAASWLRPACLAA
jgi:hypothetical protein